MKHGCSARRYSDQMSCSKCGLAWDVNDPEPPECKTVRNERIAEATLREIRAMLGTNEPNKAKVKM